MRLCDSCTYRCGHASLFWLRLHMLPDDSVPTSKEIMQIAILLSWIDVTPSHLVPLESMQRVRVKMTSASLKMQKADTQNRHQEIKR